MHGCRPPSFFLTKKKLEDMVDMEGQMYPCFRASVTYVSIANVSSCDSGYT
jgi:hypothetical protein